MTAQELKERLRRLATELGALADEGIADHITMFAIRHDGYTFMDAIAWDGEDKIVDMSGYSRDEEQGNE